MGRTERTKVVNASAFAPYKSRMDKVGRESRSAAAFADEKAREARATAALADEKAREARTTAALAEEEARKARTAAALADEKARQARKTAADEFTKRQDAAIHVSFVRLELLALKALKPLFWEYVCRVGKALEAQGGRHYNDHCPDDDAVETAFVVVCQDVTNETKLRDDANSNTYGFWLSAFTTEFVKSATESPKFTYSCLNTLEFNQKKDSRLEITQDGRNTVDGDKEVPRLVAGEVVDCKYPGHICGPRAYRYFAVPTAMFIEVTRA